ncbi:hypothetical protein BT96DRAFT_1004267 [Gymnopus androsaceus JB14]|uniref:Uncharacterized protein n=1 Tax=Gymnopus androsaceus JB14 TaxID=1447944 RepID=A0A6A4GRR1_9AGAR|nr:hypothetical protein BT96DRAFT_1004267 [Gymnopus androsaceus JB14]
MSPLYAGLGLLPVRVRRVELALCYLIYLVQLSSHDLACTALQASSALREHNKPSWLSNLDWVIRDLPGSTSHLPPLADLSTESITSLLKSVRADCLHHLHNDIVLFHRLRLLDNRLEPSADGSTSSPIIHLHHYHLVCGSLTPMTFRALPGFIHQFY